MNASMAIGVVAAVRTTRRTFDQNNSPPRRTMPLALWCPCFLELLPLYHLSVYDIVRPLRLDCSAICYVLLALNLPPIM